MRVLVTGATGFIGRAVAEALERAGHEVLAASRRGAVRVDMADVPPASWWRQRLRGVDAVVNAVGILREDGRQTFRALHADAPTELFRACADEGVRCVVQVSALGADAQAGSRYHLSKKVADDFLRSLPLRATIVQPSLVYGPGGSSAGLFNMLAAAPLLMLPGGGRMDVQPVHVDDVVDGIVAAVQAPPPAVQTVAFTGPEAMTLREYLGRLRRALGYRWRQWVLPMPAAWFRLGAAIAGRVAPRGFLDSETAGMLLRGNAADAGDFRRLLGRAPRAVDEFVASREASTLRTQAAIDLWAPVLRISLALLWIWTAAVSFGLHPVQDSLALLERVGLHGPLARVALYGAAALDLALGVLTLVLPARHRGPLWAAQLLLVGGYTVLITLFLPEYWLHPYGPISKNVPVVAAIALLWALDAARRERT